MNGCTKTIFLKLNRNIYIKSERLNKNYLLKSEHYYCMLLCKGSEPSMSALVNRGCKLKQRH